MNIRMFSLAILISALPQLAIARPTDLKLNHGDFLASERLGPDGEAVLNVKLSKSGKAKLKKLQTK